MLPPPPPLLSTTTDWPSTGANAWASMRADRSVVPAATVGTTMVTVRLGEALCADTPAAVSTATKVIASEFNGGRRLGIVIRGSSVGSMRPMRPAGPIRSMGPPCRPPHRGRHLRPAVRRQSWRGVGFFAWRPSTRAGRSARCTVCGGWASSWRWFRLSARGPAQRAIIVQPHRVQPHRGAGAGYDPTPMTARPTVSPALPALQWDLFCRVIDNLGDIGVCWRLAAQLAARGQRVRLWVSDASALRWMAPGGCRGVEVRAWQAPPPTPDEPAPQVLLEAFGCEIPPEFIAYSANRYRASGQRPVWINLEYLSAQRYVERNHRLPSPISSGPARGCTRWFFYPRFTPAPGAHLREPELMQRRQAFDRMAWRKAFAASDASDVGNVGDVGGTGAGRRWMSLFCYEPPALAELLAQLRQRPTQLLVTPGRAS